MLCDAATFVLTSNYEWIVIMKTIERYSRLNSGTFLPYMPFSYSSNYKATVDPSNGQRVNIKLTGQTWNGPTELQSLEGEASLLFQNVGGGYLTLARKYVNNTPDTYYWEFAAAGMESHFTISDGTGNPFRINFKRVDEQSFKFECEFVAAFGEDAKYNPNDTYLYIDYPIVLGGVCRDNF